VKKGRSRERERERIGLYECERNYIAFAKDEEEIRGRRR
jgi:hypothetical protein